MLRVALSSQKGESATYWYTACNLPCALTPPVFLHLPCVQSDVLIPIASRHATNTLLYHAQFLLFRDGEQCVLWNRWLTKRPKRHDVLIQNLLCMKYYHKRTFYSFFFFSIPAFPNQQADTVPQQCMTPHICCMI